MIEMPLRLKLDLNKTCCMALLTKTATVALVGNPNTGKTTLFNALAGMNQRVGNYPGVTVETKKGKCRHAGQEFDIIDLPGTYSLSARSPDEMVAVDVLLGREGSEHKPDLVVSIVDASNLERNLFLTTQVLDLGLPVVVALNMIDMADGLGVKIDVERLQEKLGLPIVPMQANKGKGIDQLKTTIVELMQKSSLSAGPTFPDAFETEVNQVAKRLDGGFPPALARRLLLDVGGQTERLVLEAKGAAFADHLLEARRRLASAGCGVPGIEARTRYAWIRRATEGCVRRPAERKRTWTDSLDKFLTHWFGGSLVFLTVMLVVFLSIFYWAKPLMDIIGVGQGWLADLVKGAMDPGPFRSLIVDGVIKGVGGVIVFLPQILILFAFLAVLEDCGYMARAAYLMDRLMARAGLNGKSFIPLLSSMACAVPGIMAARVIENRRDRLATILVAPLMSCSARLPVYALLIGAFLTEGHAWWVPGLTFFCMYMIGLVVAPLMALLLKRTLLRGETPAFVMEMPLYKLPSPRLVLRRSIDAGWMFLRRAGTIILASMIVVWALLYFPATAPDGESYETKIAELEEANEADLAKLETLDADLEPVEAKQLESRVERGQREINELHQEWKSQSLLGRAGIAIEPAVRPLGWDWRIGMAALASFPAREVIVGVLGIIFGEGEVDSKETNEVERLRGRLQTVKNENGRPVFSIPVALSLMVFFALCAQCVSTLAVIRRETNSWGWPIFTFVYMTAFAYIGAWGTFQVGSWFVG
jgi:ferrous iron transport protein B